LLLDIAEGLAWRDLVLFDQCAEPFCDCIGASAQPQVPVWLLTVACPQATAADLA
jgi:hypothetical protein